MVKSYSKLILVSIIAFIVVITAIVVIFSTKKSSTSTIPSSLTPTSSLSPTPYFLNPNPSLVPPADFTGADDTQILPAEIQSFGEQKTALRRLTPLALPFGTIDFDYENDVFLVQLLDPVEESKTQFTSWRINNYPSLTESQFTTN